MGYIAGILGYFLQGKSKGPWITHRLFNCHWHFLATRPRKKGSLRPGNCNLRCENQGAKGFFHGLDAASPSKVEGCSICLEDIGVAKPEAVRLPCSHCYHPRCLKNWFVRKLRCPLCNVAVE